MDKKKTKVLFLYTEIAGYFLACINELCSRDNVEVHIVKWPVNAQAPFTFKFNAAVFFYERNRFDDNSLFKLVSTIAPDIIYCAGWIDKGYLSVCKKIEKSIPVVLGFDNVWTGSVKQRLSLWYAKKNIVPFFTHCFIPGNPQKKFALKLGFEDAQIIAGVYCADTNYFTGFYQKYKAHKQASFPKRFIYVGRYAPEKDVKRLWDTFVQLQNEEPNDWELWCLGTGTVKPLNHSKIKHVGFVQPNELEKYISQTGVFVLPSIFEPWGVVVHEFASAGFPLLCSNKVGATSAFVKDGINGYVFEAANSHELKASIKKIMNASGEELIKMAEQSVELSKSYTPALWVDKLLSLIKKQK